MEDFAVQMAVGLVVGVVGAAVLLWLMRNSSLPDRGLYPLQVLAVAGAIYGIASVLHGSGFLAVFIAGLLIGDERAPYKAEIESFHTSLASLAEIAVFIVLGLTIDVTQLADEGWWLEGAVVFLVLAFVLRPLVVLPLLLPSRLRRGERLFVAWGGLKGAVPILLAAFAVLGGVDEADRIYGIVFVVVLLSVLVQGSTLERAAGALRGADAHGRAGRLRGRGGLVPLPRRRRLARRRAARSATCRSARAAGSARSSATAAPRTPRGADVLEPGDEVVLLADPERVPAMRRLFERR